MKPSVKTVKNSRRMPRRVFARRVGILHNGKYEVSFGMEIGEGGLAMFAPSEIQPGTKVTVTFAPLDGRFVVARAVVANWIPPNDKIRVPTLGLEFLDVDMSVRRAIRTYVAIKSFEEQKMAAQLINSR